MTLPLDVDALKVSADNGQLLLDIPSLRLAAGGSLGIRGPSGAGKSILLYALSGLLERLEGSLCWGNTNLVGLSPARCAAFRERHVGMIFQDFLLFEELDALSNAGLSALFRPRSERAAISARAAEHLKRLGIKDGSRKVASFSGGERQRVAVARALAVNPDILLADEPTASLHRSAADRLSQDLVALAQDAGTSLIVVSHDEHLLSSLDRVLTIADGCPDGEPVTPERSADDQATDNQAVDKKSADHA